MCRTKRSLIEKDKGRVAQHYSRSELRCIVLLRSFSIGVCFLDKAMAAEQLRLNGAFPINVRNTRAAAHALRAKGLNLRDEGGEDLRLEDLARLLFVHSAAEGLLLQLEDCVHCLLKPDA